ncbi:MAG: carboxypeptidase regulatory-like domain-containing protein [Desulfobulbaceae bacterium]|nr:carboxypeptidase regulatory-like domain-containing protein [Desulfobulbaceae bacterium]
METKQYVPLLSAVVLTAALMAHDCRAADATGDLAAVPDSARAFCRKTVQDHFETLGRNLSESSMALMNSQDAFIVGADLVLEGPVKCHYLQVVSGIESTKIATEVFSYEDFASAWQGVFNKIADIHFTPYHMQLPLRTVYQTQDAWRKRVGVLDETRDKGIQISNSLKIGTSHARDGYRITPVIDTQLILKIALRPEKGHRVKKVTVDFSDGRKTDGSVRYKRVGPGFSQPQIVEQTRMTRCTSVAPVEGLAHGDYRVTYEDAFCGCSAILQEDRPLDFWKNPSPAEAFTMTSIPATVTGILLDPRTAEPVRDAAVMLVPACAEPDMKPSAPVKSDSRGSFTFPAVPKGRYKLTADGHDLSTIDNCDFPSAQLDLGTVRYERMATYDIKLELDCLTDPTCAVSAVAEWKNVGFKYTYGIHPDETDRAREANLSIRTGVSMPTGRETENDSLMERPVIPFVDAMQWNLVVISDMVMASKVKVLQHAWGFTCTSNAEGNNEFEATATRNTPVVFPPQMASPPYNTIMPHTLFFSWGIDLDCKAPGAEMSLQNNPGASEFPTGLEEFAASPLLTDAHVTPEIIGYIREGRERFTVTYSWEKPGEGGMVRKSYKLTFIKSGQGTSSP